MPSYRPPLRDMQFVLHELLDVAPALRALPPYAEVDRETIDAVLEEGGKFAADILFPLNRTGDEEGCRLDTTSHAVTTPKGFKQAYAQFIEGGWPGSNPKDIEFFAQAKRKKFKNARLAAFGSTRKKATPVERDDQVRLLIEAGTPVVTIYGKTSMLHVKEVLRCTPDENLGMIGDTIRYLKDHGKKVIYDAEHSFDGFADEPEFTNTE